ncbi:DUF1877 family protein [Streptomyces collinus]|uniref:DUF1877 family protein n=1 Tax=Streptomyces collinus TaxID=42684 RepID=UPI0028835716|nr:DUF1877 family protein [Streptomyces collinus]WMX66885.1 DUF1877 family protein [Streptomyces collinus]
MSVIGEYLRVTAAELDQAIRDPDWALDFVEEVQDAEEETEPCAGRSASLHHIQGLGLAPLPAGAHRVPRERDPR